MAFMINLAGKGGAGKTTLAAMLIDELARRAYPGRLLAIDGDPAMTLAMTLGLANPPLTLAELRDSTPLNARQLKGLPPGVSPAQVILDRLTRQGFIAPRQVRDLRFDLLVMGHGEGPGCYCRINGALRQALATLKAAYELVIVDNEAGLEHISRYRLNPIDLQLVVLTPARSSWKVAGHLQDLAERLKLQIGQTWQVYNQVPPGGRKLVPGPQMVVLPVCETIAALDQQGGPVQALLDSHPWRLALAPLLERIWADSQVDAGSDPAEAPALPGANGV